MPMDFWQSAAQVAATLVGGGLIIWLVVSPLLLCEGGERKDE